MMFELIAEILPDYSNEMADLLALLGGYMAGGLLIVLFAWAVGYAVRALFDMVEFMTL